MSAENVCRLLQAPFSSAGASSAAHGFHRIEEVGMQRTALVVAVGLGIVAAGAGVAAAGPRITADPREEAAAEQAFTEAHQEGLAVSAATAEQAALGRHPGRVFDTHLQDEGGLRWETKVDDGSIVWEVQVDPDTAAVVSDHQDD
jgi:uncharacterized membrane protein YkoI